MAHVPREGDDLQLCVTSCTRVNSTVLLSVAVLSRIELLIAVAGAVAADIPSKLLVLIVSSKEGEKLVVH